EGPQHAQIAVDRLARKRIEQHVDAVAAGDLQDLVGIHVRARVEHVVHAQQAKEVALLVGARGAEDLGAALLRDLDGRDADAPGRAVDQDSFARFEAREVVERIVRGQESARYGGRGLEGHAGRDRGKTARRRHYPARKAPRPEPDDTVARSEIRDLVSDVGDDTGAFE